MDSLRSLREEDKKKRETNFPDSDFEKSISQPEDDILDDHFLGNLIVNPWNNFLEINFTSLKKYMQIMNRIKYFCTLPNVNMSIEVPDSENVLKCIVQNEKKTVQQPFSLQHIAVAASIPTLINYDIEVLIAVQKIVKNQCFQVRVGPDHRRKCYDFESILRNHLFLKMGEPLLTAEYFEFIKKNPRAFCSFCGFSKHLKETKQVTHSCRLCSFLKHGFINTLPMEKNSHDILCEKLF